MKDVMSIIIPVYNRAWELPRTVASIVAQDYRPIRLILVDNNSTDDSLSVCREMQQKYQDAIKKAYYDAYITDLKQRGYKIKYKINLLTNRRAYAKINSCVGTSGRSNAAQPLKRERGRCKRLWWMREGSPDNSERTEHRVPIRIRRISALKSNEEYL